MEFIFGIWLFDVLNVLKYNGVDLLDGVINITHLNWLVILIAAFCICAVIEMIDESLDD